MMKTNKLIYESPKVELLSTLLVTSVLNASTPQSNEGAEEGSTSDWFNN